MRIAMMTNNYKPFIGGVPISIERLSDALKEMGNEVYIFAPSYKNQTSEKGVIRYHSAPGNVAGAAIPDSFDPMIYREMKELKIDVIHVHHPILMGNAALHLGKKLQIPVVFTYHTMYEEYMHYLKPLKLINQPAKVLLSDYLKYFANQCDLLYAPTPQIKQYLDDKGIRTQIQILPTGLCDDSFQKDEERVDCLYQKYKRDTDYLYLTVQRLAEEKNLYFMMRAMKLVKAELKEKGKTCKLLMIGEGPEREKLTKTINDYGLSEEVLLLGKMDNEVIRDYQNLCDAFLFSSKSETQGIVLLEAMAAGTPVVAVEANGVNDIVENGVNGFRTIEKESEWAKKVVMVAKNRTLHDMLSQGARKTALKYKENEVAKQAELGYAAATINYYEKQHIMQTKESVVY